MVSWPARFLLTSDANLERVQEAFTGTDMKLIQLIQSNLSAEQEQTLREEFGED